MQGIEDIELCPLYILYSLHCLATLLVPSVIMCLGHNGAEIPLCILLLEENRGNSVLRKTLFDLSIDNYNMGSHIGDFSVGLFDP